ncbi:MAG: hypothetical protein HYW05_01650 [Candidatus Diapherotrites archaeon]|nr:hypothetical protein [Candidatus Diapherotrites archaeon]
MADVAIIKKRKPYPEETGKLVVNPLEVKVITAKIKRLEGSMPDSGIYTQLKNEGFQPHDIRDAFRRSNRALIRERGGVPVIAKRVNSSVKPKFNLFERLRKFRILIPKG